MYPTNARFPEQNRPELENAFRLRKITCTESVALTQERAYDCRRRPNTTMLIVPSATNPPAESIPCFVTITSLLFTEVCGITALSDIVNQSARNIHYGINYGNRKKEELSALPKCQCPQEKTHRSLPRRCCPQSHRHSVI